MQNSNDVKPLNLQGQGDELRSEPIKILSKEELSGKDYITDMSILLGGANVDESGTIPNTSMTDVERLNWQQSENKVIVDSDNYPQNMPDKDTCETLDKLFNNNQLSSRKVRYYVSPSHFTEVFDEYSYNGRKFIRLKAMGTIDQFEEGKFYWIESKPIRYDKILFPGYTSETGKTR